MLLKAAEGWEDHPLPQPSLSGGATVERLRQRLRRSGAGGAWRSVRAPAPSQSSMRS